MLVADRPPARSTRIALVTPMHFGAHAYVGGGERYPLNLARGLLAADPQVHVDLIGVGTPSRVFSPQPRLVVHVLPVAAQGSDPLDHVASGIGEVLEDADFVHVHQAFTRASQIAILVAKFLGKPLAVTDHGAITNQIERAVGYLDLVDLFIFQSEFAAAQVTGGRARVTIPGGVDDHFFRPAPQPVEREFVLFAGRLLPHKGIDRMLSALPADLPCVVVGRPYDPAYARYLKALAARRDVKFIYDADDLVLRDLYRHAWAAVLPSVHRDAWGGVYQSPELMGFTPLESMACGTPAIVSTAAALPEFVRDGETGFVFGGLAELAGRLEELSSGETSADELGGRARAVIEAEYSLTVVGERIRRAYAGMRGPG